jgi:hypothetical protein
MVLATTSTGLTAGLLELVVELVEIRRREPLERDSIEAWNDVALEVSAVGVPRLDADFAAMAASRPSGHRLAGWQPFVAQVLGERLTGRIDGRTRVAFAE